MRTISTICRWMLIGVLQLGIVFAADTHSYDMVNAKQLNDKLLVGGQPSVKDLDLAKEQGVLTVISLRGEAEKNDFNEAEELSRRDMQFVSIPVAGKNDITFDNANRLKQALNASPTKVLLHCASSNRVGALMALNASADGKSVEEAINIGKSAGLTSLESVVRERIAAQANVAR